MSLIAMAVYCTEENKKYRCFSETLYHLIKTVDLGRHRIVFSVNAATLDAKRDLEYYREHRKSISIIYNDTNIGTAKAINRAWKMRQPGEHCVKMDDDIVIHSSGWVEEMERAIATDPMIGQVGL